MTVVKRLLLLAVLLPTLARADFHLAERWTVTDSYLLASALTLTVVDGLQTITIARYPSWHEHNPLLGYHPSVPRVRNYMLGALAGEIVLSLVLPKRWRHATLATIIGIEALCVTNNKSVGLYLSSPW